METEIQIFTDSGLDNSSENSFILSNTFGVTLEEVKEKHLIPVFAKDNEPTISHVDFIQTTIEAVSQYFCGEVILSPSVRVSHPIKGRVPDAKNKAANELEDHEKTVYYERMAFVIEIPSVRDEINQNELCLTIGGVKSYSLDKLNKHKGVDEHFKIFIGFKNTVCCNLCIWSDGYVEDLRVNNLSKLFHGIHTMIGEFNLERQLSIMSNLKDFTINEHEFATLIGRIRMYQYLSNSKKKEIPELKFGDSQIGMITRDYFHDRSFCKDSDGNINLWKVYNLFTGANKQSYIDTFLGRGVNALDFVGSLAASMESGKPNWFLS